MKRKIIFLPGLFTEENEKLYIEIKKYFEKKDFHFVFFQYYNEKRTKSFSIKKTVEKLEKYLNKYKNTDNVIFIGHSMAGPILMELFIKLKLKNKLILLDPSIVPIPKHLHSEVVLKKKNRNYLFWGSKESTKEINKIYLEEYTVKKTNYCELRNKEILVFFSNLKLKKKFLKKEFEKTYSYFRVIQIAKTDHYFKNKEKEVFKKISKFLN